MQRLVFDMNRITLSQQEFLNGTQAARQEFLVQIYQQPIHFTVAGFCVIDKNFAASVGVFHFLETVPIGNI